MNRFTKESALELLNAADVFYSIVDRDDPEEDIEPQTLNMDYVWGWALAWGQKVSDEELPELAELFWDYGWGGILYWMSRKHGNMRSEFHDNNRKIDFVAYEENFRKKVQGSSAQAYTKISYTLGDLPALFPEEIKSSS
jgi:hypothetical protein